jgi:hypothetical protein
MRSAGRASPTALLRDSVADLHKKLDQALTKITDPDTRTRLQLIQARLNDVA